MQTVKRRVSTQARTTGHIFLFFCGICTGTLLTKFYTRLFGLGIASRFQHSNQLAKSCFKFNSIPVTGIVIGFADTKSSILRGNTGGTLHRQAGCHCANKGGSKDIAGTMEAFVNFLMGIVEPLPCLTDDHTGLIRAVAYAGQYHSTTTKGAKLCQQGIDIGFIISFLIGMAGH